MMVIHAHDRGRFSVGFFVVAYTFTWGFVACVNVPYGRRQLEQMQLELL